jgi:hypothetical protein
MTADLEGKVLSCGPEAWLEWTYLEGWNLLLRHEPLELAAPTLVDLVAVAEPALMSSGFELADPAVAALLEACATALKAEQAALSITLERKRREEEARIRAAAERERALLEAMRMEAEASARAEEAAEAAALEEEMARLRARTPLEILQEEVAELKKQLSAKPVAEPLHLRADGELDMRFRNSREELTSARKEIAAVKAQMADFLSGKFVIRSVLDGRVLDIEGGQRNIIAHAHHGGANQLWTLKSV